MSDPQGDLPSLYGTLTQSGWISTDPRTGDDILFVYLAPSGTGSSGVPVAQSMRLIATAVGLDPDAPLAAPPPVGPGVNLTLTSDGWLTLAVDGQQVTSRPLPEEHQSILRARKEAVLILSFQIIRSDQAADQHMQQSFARGELTFGLIPYKPS